MKTELFSYQRVEQVLGQWIDAMNAHAWDQARSMATPEIQGQMSAEDLAEAWYRLWWQGKAWEQGQPFKGQAMWFPEVLSMEAEEVSGATRCWTSLVLEHGDEVIQVERLTWLWKRDGNEWRLASWGPEQQREVA